MPSLSELVDEIDRESAGLAQAGADSHVRENGEAAGRPIEPYIRFTLAHLLLAIPMAASTEIGQLQRPTPLPNLPGWVLGVTNVRGDIVSVIDLGAFLGLPTAGDRRGRSKMLIRVHHADITAGLAVDRVLGLFHLDRRTPIRPSPYREGDPEASLSDYIEGVLPPEAAGLDGEHRLLNLLDVEALMTSSRMTAFRNE